MEMGTCYDGGRGEVAARPRPSLVRHPRERGAQIPLGLLMLFLLQFMMRRMKKSLRRMMGKTTVQMKMVDMAVDRTSRYDGRWKSCFGCVMEMGACSRCSITRSYIL